MSLLGYWSSYILFLFEFVDKSIDSIVPRAFTRALQQFVQILFYALYIFKCFSGSDQIMVCISWNCILQIALMPIISAYPKFISSYWYNAFLNSNNAQVYTDTTDRLHFFGIYKSMGTLTRSRTLTPLFAFHSRYYPYSAVPVPVVMEFACSGFSQTVVNFHMYIKLEYIIDNLQTSIIRLTWAAGRIV